MARPMGPNDFLDSLNLSPIFSSQEKINLGKIFRRTVGKTLRTTQTATSSTTYADVSDLTFNVKKGAKYRIEGKLLTLGDAGGIKLQLNVTGQTSPTVVINGVGTLAAAVVAQQALTGGVIIASTSAFLQVDVNGYYIPDKDGVMTLQFAQNASNPAASTLYAGSHIKLIRVG